MGVWVLFVFVGGLDFFKLVDVYFWEVVIKGVEFILLVDMVIFLIGFVLVGGFVR